MPRLPYSKTVESGANDLQGTRLQVLAQADNREEGTPDFDEQHLNLRRGDIIGSYMEFPLSKSETSSNSL